MQCKFIIKDTTSFARFSEKRCDRKALRSEEYCAQHLEHKFPKPDTCPVCFGSLHQCVRPLECHHWVHRSCVRKSGKAECPICRTKLTDIKNVHKLIVDDPLDELFANPEVEVIEIPRNSIVFAVIAFKLYATLIQPDNRIMGLDHFIHGVLDVFIPSDHPSHEGIASFLYAQALEYYFNPTMVL